MHISIIARACCTHLMPGRRWGRSKWVLLRRGALLLSLCCGELPTKVKLHLQLGALCQKLCFVLQASLDTTLLGLGELVGSILHTRQSSFVCVGFFCTVEMRDGFVSH